MQLQFNHSIGTSRAVVTNPELGTLVVEQLTGVPARSFREWTQDPAGDLRYMPSADSHNQGAYCTCS